MANLDRVSAQILMCAVAVSLLTACGAEVRPDAGSSVTKSSSSSLSPSRATPYDESTRVGGDAAPHHAENNAWKYPPDLTPSRQRIADAAAERIRPALHKLRTAQNFDPDSVRSALEALGFSADSIGARAFDIPAWWTQSTPPPGVVFGLRVQDGVCLTGDVRPERVLIESSGPNVETGCMPLPATH